MQLRGELKTPPADRIPAQGKSTAHRGTPPSAAAPGPSAAPNAAGVRGVWWSIIDPLTLEDLASFRPTPPVGRMEPVGWTVIGLPTNFWAEVVPQTHEGTLLDLPASVRFTPARYTWSFGDGTSTTVAAKGQSWDASRLQEFDATPTSHVYRTRGTYSVVLTVGFTAEYRFDGGDWISVEGMVRSSAAPLGVVAGTASTVLVAEDCVANPAGPGC